MRKCVMGFLREIDVIMNLLKELDHTSKHFKGYIQYLSYQPFVVINYTEEQINMLREACRKREAFLYFDASGLSMKRPYMLDKRIFIHMLVLRTR